MWYVWGFVFFKPSFNILGQLWQRRHFCIFQPSELHLSMGDKHDIQRLLRVVRYHKLLSDTETACDIRETDPFEIEPKVWHQLHCLIENILICDSWSFLSSLETRQDQQISRQNTCFSLWKGQVLLYVWRQTRIPTISGSWCGLHMENQSGSFYRPNWRKQANQWDSTRPCFGTEHHSLTFNLLTRVWRWGRQPVSTRPDTKNAIRSQGLVK